MLHPKTETLLASLRRVADYEFNTPMVRLIDALLADRDHWREDTNRQWQEPRPLAEVIEGHNDGHDQ